MPRLLAASRAQRALNAERKHVQHKCLKTVCSASKLARSLGPDLAPGLHSAQSLIERVCFALKMTIPILRNSNKKKKALNILQVVVTRHGESSVHSTH